MRELWSLPVDAKERIARQYGDMMGCFAKAKMLHGDLHGENVLVTHNLKERKRVERSDRVPRLHFQFHAIDWGKAETINPESYEKNGVPKTVCLHFDRLNKYIKNSSVDKLQRKWRLMFGIQEYDKNGNACKAESWHGSYLLLLALFHPYDWEKELPTDDVTRAQVLDWVRMAFVDRLGAEYPLEERAKMNELIEEERTVPKHQRTHQV